MNFSDNNRKTFFTTSSHPPPTSYYNEFIIGAFDLSHDTFYTYTDYFNFNLWHHYPNLSYNQISNNWYTQGWDWHIASPEDLLEADESEYGQTIEDILDDNINAGMNTFFQRPKFEQIFYGQRSDYQAEETHGNPDLSFYTFKTSYYRNN